MSDFNDKIKWAIENHYDCDQDDRFYTWGSYIDLCGMSVEDALPYTPGGEGGDSSGKTKNTATLFMQKNSSDNYTLCISLSKAPSSNVTVLYTMDGSDYTAVINAGSTLYDTGKSGEDPSKPYATIGSVSMQSETDTFTIKSNVKNGYFKLTVRNNGSTTMENLKYGTEYTLPSASTKEGYDFIWKDSKGNVITGSTYTMPESDETLDGKYYVKSYTLSYTITTEGEGTPVEGSMVVNYGVKILSLLNPLTPAKTGYSLVGWRFQNDTVITSATTMPAADSAAKNEYKLAKYAVIYMADGAEFARTEYFYGEATQLIAETPTKTGYNFVSWVGDLPATMPAHNVTLTASFSAIIYYIRYYVDGAKAYEEQHIYNDTISIRANETKEGYTFSGWNPSALPAKMPAEDIEVVGTFSINSYVLKYFVDGAEYSAFTYEYGESISPIANPTREGYTFSGWNNVPVAMPAHNVNVNGTFTINSHTLAYYVDGSLESSITYNYGESITPIAAPTREGYTFSGWDDVPSEMPDHDVDVHGTFSINQYTITYNIDGAFYSAETYDYNAIVTPIAEPEAREGYTFGGWVGVPAKMPANDVTVNGAFNINSYVLSYYIDNELSASTTYEYGAVITPEANPTREGYTFSGWTNLPATMPAEDVRVDGSFTINQYTLKFLVDNVEISSITADYGTQISVQTPAKEGYTFSGWDKNVPATMPAYDDIFYGTFSINSYTANYVIDGVPQTSITYEYGELINYPDIPRSGYTLEWTIEYITMPASSITINGTYVEIVETKTIYYDTVLTNEENNFSGVTGMASVECDKGETANVPVIIPASEEYAELEALAAEEEIPYKDFDAWCDEHNYSGRIAVPTAMNFDYFNGGGQSIKGGLIEIGDSFMIDGNEYQAYAYHIGTCCIATEQTFSHTIENKTPAEG